MKYSLQCHTELQIKWQQVYSKHFVSLCELLTEKLLESVVTIWLIISFAYIALCLFHTILFQNDLAYCIRLYSFAAKVKSYQRMRYLFHSKSVPVWPDRISAAPCSRHVVLSSETPMKGWWRSQWCMRQSGPWGSWSVEGEFIVTTWAAQGMHCWW